MYISQRALFKVTSFILMSGLLSACTPDIVKPTIIGNTNTVPAVPASAIIADANKLFHVGKKREAAEGYFSAAASYPSPSRERLMLQAAEIAASLSNPELVEQYLNPVDVRQLTPTNKARYDYTKGLSALLNKQPEYALDLFPKTFKHLTPEFRNKILLARMRAADATPDAYIGVREKAIQLPYQSQTQHTKQGQIIWNYLVSLNNKELQEKRRVEKNIDMRGWLDLATIDHQINNGINVKESIAAWKRQFPNHHAHIYSAYTQEHAQNQILNTIHTQATSKEIPENELLPMPSVDTALRNAAPTANTTSEIAKKSTQTQSIAVLLPLSGGLKNISHSIMQGINHAQQEVHTFDTSHLDSSVQYNSAVNKHADIILGPFSKTNLHSIAQNGYLSKPLISLNYLPDNKTGPKNLYQFGLLPEDEAKQVAQQALKQGKKIALMITPNSAWGERLSKAFKHHFETSGGRVIGHEKFSNTLNKTDTTVKRLLEKKADMVFLAASPNQARMVYPAIKARNNTIPVMSTSHIFSGNPAIDKDKVLDGIIYTEIPFILQSIKTKPSILNQRYPRLIALGQDAITVAKKLTLLQQGQAIHGNTGTITVGQGNRLQRQLSMAIFKNGLPSRL